MGEPSLPELFLVLMYKNSTVSKAKKDCQDAKGKKCTLIMMLELNFKLKNVRDNSIIYLKMTDSL